MIKFNEIQLLSSLTVEKKKNISLFLMFCNKVLIKSRLTKNNKQGKLQSFTLQIQIQCLKKKKRNNDKI